MVLMAAISIFPILLQSPTTPHFQLMPFYSFKINFYWSMVAFPGNSAGKESSCNAGDPSSISGLGRSTGEGKGYPLQYSGLENSMDRGAWQATVHGAAEWDMTERLSLMDA